MAYNDNQENEEGLLEKLIKVKRVTKVVKGGRSLRYTALAVVGDGMVELATVAGKPSNLLWLFRKQCRRHAIT